MLVTTKAKEVQASTCVRRPTCDKQTSRHRKQRERERKKEREREREREEFSER